jgi:hypothetical protein
MPQILGGLAIHRYNGNIVGCRAIFRKQGCAPLGTQKLADLGDNVGATPGIGGVIEDGVTE